MPKVSPEHKAAVRQQLVEATARVMDRQESPTTRAITAEADVSAGTLYNYFDNLAELIEAAGEWILAGEWRQFSPEIDPDGPYGGLIDVLDEFLLRPPAASEAVSIPRLRSRVDLDEERYAAIRRYNQFVVDLTVPLVTESAEAGHVSSRVDARALVELLDLVRDGLIIRHEQDSFATSFEQVGAALVEVLEHGALRSGSRSESTTRHGAPPDRPDAVPSSPTPVSPGETKP